MSVINIPASDLNRLLRKNKTMRVEYSAGDTLVITGEESLNDIGWLSLIKGNRKLHSPFHLVLANGQRDFNGLKFGDPRHELKVLSIQAHDIDEVPAETFRRCRYLEEVKLHSARTIHPRVFAECPRLRKISLPSAEKVFDSAFELCPELQYISLPRAKEIGENAFRYCRQLIQLYLPMVEEVRSGTFSECPQLVSAYLPHAVRLGGNAFSGCDRLRRVKMPDVMRISAHCFLGCSTLASINFPQARVIDEAAFKGCVGIKHVRFPSLEEIKASAFEGCNNLWCIDAPCLKSIDAGAFHLCPNFGNIVVPETTEVDPAAFDKNVTVLRELPDNSLARLWLRGDFISMKGLDVDDLHSAVESGLPPNIRLGQKGIFLLVLLLMTNWEKRKELASKLISLGAEVDVLDEAGRSALARVSPALLGEKYVPWAPGKKKISHEEAREQWKRFFASHGWDIDVDAFMAMTKRDRTED